VISATNICSTSMVLLFPNREYKRRALLLLGSRSASGT
jgi:hypothetical protein